MHLFQQKLRMQNVLKRVFVNKLYIRSMLPSTLFLQQFYLAKAYSHINEFILGNFAEDNAK